MAFFELLQYDGVRGTCFESVNVSTLQELGDVKDGNGLKICVVFDRKNALGLAFCFINIYAEELSDGQTDVIVCIGNQDITKSLIKPFQLFFVDGTI